MSAGVNIYKINDVQDWERIGYYHNRDLTSRKVTSVNFLPFAYYGLSKSTTISNFELRKLSFTNGIKSIESTTTLSTAYIDFDIGANRQTFYYNADEDLGVTASGNYEYYIKDSANKEYYSELMCFAQEGVTTGGSYDASFDASFDKGSTTSTNALKIEAYDIPNIYPETGSSSDRFKDVFYTSNILEKIDTSSIVIETEKPYLTTYDPNNWLPRKVQSLVYDVYELIIFGGEHSNIGLIDNAESVVITDKFGKVYIADFLEPIKYNSLGDTKNREYILIFQDINIDNYHDRVQPVANFQTNTYLQTRYDTTKLASINLTSQSTSDEKVYYTSLIEELDFDIKHHTEEYQKTVYIVQKITKYLIKIRFYLTDDEKKVFEYKLSNSDYQLSIKRGVSTYENIQLNNEVKYTKTNDNLIGVWQFDLQIVYNTEVFNYFDSAAWSRRFVAVGEPLYKLTLSGIIETVAVNLTLNTPIGQRLNTKPKNKEEELGTGLQIAYTMSSQTFYRLIFYASGEDAIILERYAKTNVTQTVAGIASISTLIEKPNVDVSQVDGFEDLFRIVYDVKDTSFITDNFGT